MSFLLGSLLASLLPASAAPTAAEDPSFPGTGLVVLPFLGRIDGSDRIRITREGAEWTHLYWGFPEAPVLLNDVPWYPEAQPRLQNYGPLRFLSADVDFGTAELRRIEGRDMVVLEREPGAITIHIDDTPVGAAVYRFEIVFQAVRPSVELRICARIDGSDEVRISNSGAEWVHRCWGWPQGQVSVNGVLWLPQAEDFLPNSGGTRFLPADVDFATAEVVSKVGRDLVAVEKRSEGVSVHFADNPNGSDLYEIVLRIRRAPRNPAP